MSLNNAASRDDVQGLRKSTIKNIPFISSF